jgi:N-glycosidase YbiA
MTHSDIGWFGFFILTAAIFFLTAKLAHGANMAADREGIKMRTVWAVRYAFLIVAANVAFGAVIHYFLPQFFVHTMLWTLLAEVVGGSLGLLRANSKIIRFYRERDKFGEWSNFADFPIEDGDITWATSEHKFQADKYIGTDEEQRQKIIVSKSPKDAASLGRDRTRKLRPDWDLPANIEYTGDNVNLRADWQRFCSTDMRVKDYSMIVAVRMKVRQYPKLRAFLLKRLGYLFIETKNNSYWADGGNGTGLNMLGKVIMIVALEESRRG